MLFKIFCENNEGPSSLEDEINNFFEDKLDLVQLEGMNTVTEKVDGIDYMSVIICYTYKI